MADPFNFAGGHVPLLIMLVPPLCLRVSDVRNYRNDADNAQKQVSAETAVLSLPPIAHTYFAGICPPADPPTRPH